MLKIVLFALLAFASAVLAAPNLARAEEPTTAAQPASAPVRSGRVEVNGVSYYYEVHGSGEPLLLLHGELGSMEMFAPIMPLLAATHEVVTIDLQGHGRSTLGDRPIDVSEMADDISAVLKQLGYEEIDVMGYSLGGRVALRLAVQHSWPLGRVVLVSGTFTPDGFFPEIVEQQQTLGAAMADAMKDTPLYKAYAAIAPHPEDFPKLLDRMGELMRQPYDWYEDARQIDLPVMLVYADSDTIRLDHIMEFYRLIGGGARDAGPNREHFWQNRLAILPNLTHYEIFRSPALARTVLPFLEGTAFEEQVEWK